MPNPGRAGRPLAVSFSLPRAERACVAVLDAQGRRVAASAWRSFEPGRQRIDVVLPSLAPGRYTIALRSESGVVRTRPWVVVR